MKEKQYTISISKEALSELPPVHFAGAITVIESAAVAHTALRALSKEKMVGFDTETRPCFRKGHVRPAALMQISTEDRCFLFRLNKIGICSELKDFLENPDIIKIGLSVHDDFNVLRRATPLNPQGFVELQTLVKRYDISDISLQKIYAIIFGKRISKGQRLSNWEADVLTESQQAYAALDAWACLNIYKELTGGHFDPLTSPLRHEVLPPPTQN